MQIRVGQHKLLREMNEMAVLSVVRFMGVASRMDVVQKTGLTKSTVSLATRSLMEQGLLEESGTFSGKRGRPGSLLTFRSQAGHLIGVSIDVDEYRIVLMDLAGRPLYRISGQVNAKLAPHELLKILAESIRGLLQHHAQHRVWGVGLSIPGVVSQGSVWYAPNMGWENVSVRPVLERMLNLPVYVANNADAGAIGEYYFGQGQDSRLLLYLDFGVGVGGGIVMEGQLFRGAHGVAGEVGHIVILENGPACSCGRRGCFETLASTRALIRRAQDRRGDMHHLSVHDIYQAAQEQASWALEAIHETIHYVKRGIVNSANMLDVDAIFLGGPLSQLNEYLLDEVVSALDAELLVRSHRHPMVRLATFREEAGAVGAAALVFSDAIRRPRPSVTETAASSSLALRTEMRETQIPSCRSRLD